jgi:hypothetical protein
MEISKFNAKPLANYFGSKIIAANTETVSTSAATPLNSITENAAFAENVLQALKHIGVDESNSEAIQNFTQNLYNALIQNNDIPIVSPLENLNVIESTSNASAPLKISGGTNFKYSVDFSETDLGDFLPSVQANVITALENIGKYIRSDAVFNLKILATHEKTDMLAQANATIVRTENVPDDVNADTLFISDSIRGADFDSELHDSKLYINSEKLEQMSFTGLPTPDKYDLTSILTHEILHGLAFTGLVDSPTNSDLKTAYDGLMVQQENGSLIFVGRHAKTANGGNPVPLSSVDEGAGSAYYHVAIPNDLMSPSIRKNEVKSISNLNVAMLQDMGINVTGVLPTNLKVQNTNNFVTSIESLGNNSEKAIALQSDFTQLIQASNNTSPTINFQDFLKHLAVNFSQDNNTQRGAGAIFYATA